MEPTDKIHKNQKGSVFGVSTTNSSIVTTTTKLQNQRNENKIIPITNAREEKKRKRIEKHAQLDAARNQRLI